MTPQGLEAFLSRYKNYTAQHATQQFQAFARGFERIRHALYDMKARGQVLERNTDIETRKVGLPYCLSATTLDKCTDAQYAYLPGTTSPIS